MNTRGIPVQDLPENQDPDFAYMVDEMTGAKTPLGEEKGEDDEDDEKPKRRGRPKKSAATKSADEDDTKETDAKEKSSDVSSVRELGS